MRRHVQSMRGIGRNGGVRARRLESQLGERRVIHTVNNVVRYSRMVRMPWQYLVENLGPLLLPRIRLVGRVEIAYRDELQGVENRGLVVVRVVLGNLGQRLLVILR